MIPVWSVCVGDWLIGATESSCSTGLGWAARIRSTSVWIFRCLRASSTSPRGSWPAMNLSALLGIPSAAPLLRPAQLVRQNGFRSWY